MNRHERERTSACADFRRRHGVSAVTRRRGIHRRESLSRSFTSGPRPMSRAGQSPARSGESRARSRLLRCHWRWGSSVSGASRERRPRDRPRKSSQRAWLLARALITLGTAVSAGRKPGRNQRTRTEVATSRGGESGARNGCARASIRYGRSRKFRFQPPGFVVAPIGCGDEGKG